MRHSGSGVLHPAYSHTQEVQARTCMIDVMGFNLVARSANSLQTDSSKPVELLLQCAPTVDLGKALLHSSSFGTAGSSANSTLNGRNGLVNAVLTTHNTHHALILRPDEFDFAIAAQSSSLSISTPRNCAGDSSQITSPACGDVASKSRITPDRHLVMRVSNGSMSGSTI